MNHNGKLDQHYIEREGHHYTPTKEWSKFTGIVQLQQPEPTDVMVHTNLQRLENIIIPKFVGSKPFVLCHTTLAHWRSI